MDGLAYFDNNKDQNKNLRLSAISAGENIHRTNKDIRIK